MTSYHIDFKRDVYCLFGLPIDNLQMDDTKDKIHQIAEGERQAVLSTINVNWIIRSLTDDAFRKAIINSELIVIDGKPLLWMSKLLGLPMDEVVPGSTLIESLLKEKSAKTPLSIFLFGGENKSAEHAFETINRSKGGLRAAGSLNPGYGTVTEMSSDYIISKINSSQPDILLVALGAKKGALWIESNRNRLNAKIISHLGATINFLAGTLKRAPRLMRSMGLEWVWRIFQEPKLFTRYFYDGCALIQWLMTHCHLLYQFQQLQKIYRRQQCDTDVVVDDSGKDVFIRFGRNLLTADNQTFRDLFAECAQVNKNIRLDFEQTEFVDSGFMGFLLLLIKHQHNAKKQLFIDRINRNVNIIFRLFCIQKSMRANGFRITKNNRAYQKSTFQHTEGV